jgi:hypothetical protein
VTVREHLAAVTAPVHETPAFGPQPAADLAAIYEVARYSAHAVGAADAQRFEALARAVEA